MEAADYDAAMQAAEQAWRAAERLDFDAETTATLSDNYAQLAAALGDHAGAFEAYRSTAEVLSGAGFDDELVAETWILAASSALLAGENREALRCADAGGDLAEQSQGLDPATRANLMFSSRAVHAHAFWREGRVYSAASRAREAMAVAEGYDLTDNQSYALMSFILGAGHAIEREFEDAAFRLTQAYVYMPGERAALGHWADHARRQLSEEERERLLARLSEAGLEAEQLPYGDQDEDANEHADDPGFVDAEPLRRAPPRYPDDALNAGFEGVALVKFTINESGQVEAPNVIMSIPFREFGEEVVAALERWVYEPATLNGAPVRREGLVTQVEFILEDD